MFINPQIAIKEGWIKGIVNPEKQIQPNAIDFTLDKAFTINDEVPFYVSETQKHMKGSSPYTPHEISVLRYSHKLNDGFKVYEKIEKPKETGWTIVPGNKLDCLSDLYCDLPKGISAMLIVRSTLARNGLILTSGLYDSGFQGHVGFVLHNNSVTIASIAQGTRVGQIIFVESDAAGLYDGSYKHDEGTDLEYQQ